LSSRLTRRFLLFCNAGILPASFLTTGAKSTDYRTPPPKKVVIPNPPFFGGFGICF